MFWKFLKKPAAQPKLDQAAAESIQKPVPLAFLQKLIPIGDLPVEELQALKVSWKSFNPGQMIFSRGESANALLYLYSGNIFMEAADGGGYNVDQETFKAYYPLSTHTEHYFSAIAKSPTEILCFPLSIFQRSASASLTNNPLIDNAAIPPALVNSAFFNGFCAAFRRDQLNLPSLPDVAFRLRSALQKDISIADAVKIINLDPVIASKLIQVSNSPLFRSVTPIANSHDAVNRLGLKATQNLVTSISLHNLFRSNNKTLNNKVQQLWRQSIQIASLSYTLAGLARSINPDEALLAGLTHNIGALPIITYADSLKDTAYTEAEFEQTITTLQGLVGEFILKKWNFPENVQQIPSHSSNWYQDDNPVLQLKDIVMLARFHAQLGTPNAQKLPPLNTLPAFTKLGERTLTPDMSLQTLHEAKQQIAEALSFFRT